MANVALDRNALRRKVVDAVNADLRRRAADLERCLKANAPRDTGAMAESISVDVEVTSDGRDIRGAITIGNNAASFVLNGTVHRTYAIGPNQQWLRDCVDQHFSGVRGTQF